MSVQTRCTSSIQQLHVAEAIILDSTGGGSFKQCPCHTHDTSFIKMKTS